MAPAVPPSVSPPGGPPSAWRLDSSGREAEPRREQVSLGLLELPLPERRQGWARGAQRGCSGA